jgi:hypothetical protein
LSGLDGESGNCREHHRTANRWKHKCFHSDLRFGTDAKRLLPVQARHWESPVVRKHRSRTNRGEERSIESIINLTNFQLHLRSESNDS